MVVLNDNSEVVGNVAPLGGGIYNNSSLFDSPSSVTLNDSSAITGDTATGGQAGGIENEAGSTVSVNDDGSMTGNIPDNCFPAIC